ncbi:MAG: ATPase domain-containing protein [Candidatus Aenigmarchaeota archaeon]
MVEQGATATYERKKIKTGIEGLDNLLEGGFPEKGIYILVGGCGTGKTNIGLEFIFKGATKFKERGVFVNLEEEKTRMLTNIKSFGWDFSSLEKENSVRVIAFLRSIMGDINSSLSKVCSPGGSSTLDMQKNIQWLSIDSLISLIEEAAKDIGATRLVIDPWTAVTLLAETGAMARLATMSFFDRLKKMGLTTLITVEKETAYWEQLKFLADGVIELDYVHTDGKAYRGLSVRKIRGSSFREGYFNFSITPKGIKIDVTNFFEGAKV